MFDGTTTRSENEIIGLVEPFPEFARLDSGRGSSNQSRRRRSQVYCNFSLARLTTTPVKAETQPICCASAPDKL